MKPIVIKSDRCLAFWKSLFRLSPHIRGIHWGVVLWLVSRPDEGLLRHEAIHTAQYRELGLFRFWYKYLRFHIRHGYDNNPLEREAYQHENDPDYAATRQPFSWSKYV